MDKPVNENGVFYPSDWKEQMRKFHGPPASPPRPFKVEYKVRKRHLSPAELTRQTFRVVE